VFQQLIFQRTAERPFRRAKLTACRKKCAFLSVRRHEVKAWDARQSKNGMQRPLPVDAVAQMGIIATGCKTNRRCGVPATM
jgi:hypothetical protein